jgi:hypothetical protein
MRNHVSKMLIGKGIAFKAIETLAEGEIVSMDLETQAVVTADTKFIVFAQGTANLGEPIVAGPLSTKDITSAARNNYEAQVLQKNTLTVTAVPDAGTTVLVKVVYHDNLSIVPNQMKQTVVAVTAEAGETTTTFAVKIAAEFNKQDYLFVTVTTATNVVTFEAIKLTTASRYNGIDRPESLQFEVGVPADEDGKGVYVVVRTVKPKAGQGDPAKVAWLADQHQGRLGFSDRRSWNDGRKYSAPVDGSKNYNITVLLANSISEGDMQDTRSNPIGAVLAITTDTAVGAGLFYEQLALAVTSSVIPASS